MSGVAILGGAFDPPHVGHVALAEDAVRHFRLDRLLVRVIESPGHKSLDTAPQIRLLLAELAFAPLDEAEVALDPCGRTVDSLAALRLDDPLFLIGADEFAAFLSWQEPDRVLELARLGVATRPGIDRAALDAVLSQLVRPERVELFSIRPVDVASSEIRDRIAAGEPVDGMLPAAVAAEIDRLDLYRRSQEGGYTATVPTRGS
jgi:nicotinate-nucleotide adenylyltransferase